MFFPPWKLACSVFIVRDVHLLNEEGDCSFFYALLQSFKICNASKQYRAKMRSLKYMNIFFKNRYLGELLYTQGVLLLLHLFRKKTLTTEVSSIFPLKNLHFCKLAQFLPDSKNVNIL